MILPQIEEQNSIKEKLDPIVDFAPSEQAHIQKYIERSHTLRKECEELIVEDWAQVNFANEKMKEVQKYERHIDNLRKVFKDPVMRLGRMIDDEFSFALSPTKEAKTIIKAKILAFNKNVEAQKELLKNNEEIPEDQKNLMKEEAKVKGLRKTIKWELEDANLVPREYLTLDEAKITFDSKRGVVIPGIKLYEEVSVQ